MATPAGEQLRTQCPPCPWRDMATMRQDYPDIVDHAELEPDGFVCHARCGPCPGPRRAGLGQDR